MLHLKDVTYRIQGRLLLEGMRAHLPKGHKAGLIGRNGCGKSTLFRLITGELKPDQGKVEVQKEARIGTVAQEVPGGAQTPIEHVLSANTEMSSLFAELEHEEAPMRIAEIHSRLEEINAYRAPAKAAKILAGLGFNETEQNRPLAQFSGGWRMRVALAAALFAEPDLLLLDEPTNHLDFESVTWLEGFLKSYAGTLLLISHDRHFLNSVVSRIYNLSQQKVTTYNGNYDFYEKTRREQMEIQLATAKKHQAAKEHMQKFIDRFRAKSSKARQVQSRIKMLEKFDPIVMLKDDPSLTLRFPEPQILPPPLISMEKVSVGYSGKVVLKNLNFSIAPDDRIALLGANGNGKSTFAKLVAGELLPMSGSIQHSKKLRVGHFHQHQIETLDLSGTAFTHMQDLMKDSRPEQIRARLGGFGFSQHLADVKVEKLSGGEKARLNFALVSHHEPHILIMDEPTNHLDIDTRESLILAVNEFKGAVIIISHDWHILELTTNSLWQVADHNISRFDGDLNDYRKVVLGHRSGKVEQKDSSTARAAEIKAKKQAKKIKKSSAQSGKKKKKTKSHGEGFIM